MLVNSLLNDQLLYLRTLFVQQGADIRFVGGCVRDTLLGLIPKDVDLCTDATPDEQIDIYRAAGIRYIETGLKHGTVTVVLDDVTYEITSLRQDVETDGRHAVVAYTKDWMVDLLRRDFTINAMSLTFDGMLVDPFGGENDLAKGIVRFVGDAKTRIKEDYLRILRWFRFRGRFEKSPFIDSGDLDARHAIAKLAPGLANISAERVWMEISKILAGEHGPDLMVDMKHLRVAEHIGANDIYWPTVARRVHDITRNPVTVLTALQYNANTPVTLAKWKASRDEIKLSQFLVNNSFAGVPTRSLYRILAIDGISREWVMELAALRSNGDPFERAVIAAWEIPIFPLNGNDLIAAGVKPGIRLGEILNDCKELWADSGYNATKEELLSMIDLPTALL